ncbi:armadillo-type protein [Fimicolochytrium jonesii]|uniref:armadillo-type protein n=1 Tax=Fimicolochytrium jonesii TaxID=1396493 RepID=UPI0022FDCD83|nr:armadillo-type protein [Fimicolochytrium jonesii]KAI8816085.1 armadillo-type protein [Fimicolochytrium jonesii]
MDGGEDDDFLAVDSLSTAQAELPWDQFVGQVFIPGTNSTSFSRRLAVLNGTARKLSSEALPDSQLAAVVQQLLFAVPRYPELRARKAVLQVLKSLYARGREGKGALEVSFLKGTVKLLERELKGNLHGWPPVLLFDYLQWTGLLIKCCLSPTPEPAPKTEEFTASPLWKTLIALHASLLDALGSSSGNRRDVTFSRVKASTRKIIDVAGPSGVEAILQTLLTPATIEGSEGCKRCIFVGLAMEVVVKKGYTPVFDKFKPDVLNLYLKALMTSRSPVPSAYLESLAPFFQKSLTPDVFDKEIAPTSERLLLRSPEVVIKVLDYTIRSVDFDVSKQFRTKYADAVLNHMRSTNDVVRLSAADFFKTFCSKSTEEKELVAVVDLTAKALTTKGPSVDQRQMYYSALSQLPALPAVAKKVFESSPALVTKESNDTCLQFLLQAIAIHIRAYFESPAADAKVIASIVAFVKGGVSDAKSGTRRAFLSLLPIAFQGEALKALGGAWKDLVDPVVKLVEKVQSSGIALLDLKKDTPALVEGYLAIRWLQETSLAAKDTIGADLEKRKFFTTVYSTKSFFLNEKYYGKLLQTADEQLHFVHCLLKVIEIPEWYKLTTGSGNAAERKPLASALVWFLVETRQHEVRQAAAAEIRKLLLPRDATLSDKVVGLLQVGLGRILTQGVYRGKPSGSGTWNEPISRSSDTIGHKVYGALCVALPYLADGEQLSSADTAWKNAVESGLMRLSVIACHPAVTEVMGDDVWIRLCFRSGTGPHIVDAHVGEIIRLWLVKGEGEDVSEGGFDENIDPTIRTATLAALTLFTEVATEAVIKEALPWALTALDNEDVKKLTANDVGVWSTPEGTLFFDPTAKKVNGRVDDRPKTAEEKWERELKKELQKKGKTTTGKAPETKISKAERELQQQQLAKESEIRKHVHALRHTVMVGVDVLRAVIDGVTRSVGEEARGALSKSMTQIVKVLLHSVIARELAVVPDSQQNPAVLAGHQAIDLYSQLGEVVGDDLRGLIDPPVLAMATLRALGVKEGEGGIDKWYCKKDLTAYITSVLEELSTKYTSEQPLDPGAFSYVFPLLRAIVLREGRIDQLKDREATDLAMSASDILLAQSSLAESPYVPRSGMVQCLLELLHSYPRVRGAGREGLLTLAFAISAGAPDDDEADGDGEQETGGEGVPEVVDELLKGLLSPEEAVREACVMALTHLTVPEEVSDVFDARIWLSRFDSVEAIKEQADALWSEWNGDATLSVEAIDSIIQLTVHSVEAVRSSAGRALCGILTHHPEAVRPTLEKLYGLYTLKAALPEPEYDAYGMVIPESLNKPDEWPARAGVASALKSCVPIITTLESLQSLFNFLIIGEALGDRNETVQRAVLDAGLSAANASGKTYVRELLDVIDGYLCEPARPSAVHDRIRESCVILLGTLAQHLESTDHMIPEVIAKLMETLKTPSENVQVAVSECLPALVKVNKQDARKLVEKLLHQLYTAPKYGERRGAAYGLAGVVKGCGISAIKEFGVMTSLKEAVEDKKRVEKREGALFAFETLSQTLGRLFEPYVIQIIPLLLVCFGDNSREVREATNDACRVIMSKLSAHCVKLVLPSLLNGLEDRNWRTKTGSIEVLSSMAYLAPKQLSVSLPTVVPRICDVLADSHAKVQEAAKQALNQFGNVIKNPEIQALVPVLLSALVDPNGKTNAALTALLDTAFVHYIDAPSLALLVPILQRGLRERGTDIKKKAAQIMGNMATLTDPKDLLPYLHSLMPELKEVLVDPVPEARATAAKAFGNMVAKLGEDNFPGLVAEFYGTLKSDTSGVDRSGAAQGLSEILAGLGIERLELLLPDLLINADSPKSYVREGFMTLMVYLPGTFGEKFQPYLGDIIPPVLRGLADESEPVRDCSMKTGQMIIRNYATTAVDLLLPELERGLFDESWRIRQSSVQLLGDLLYRIAGVSGKVEVDGAEEEGLGTEHGRQALLSTLGKERYNKVLASLYVARADASAIVRQASLHVWKSIVSNTPRTLKEILPIMMDIIVASLASENSDKRGSAARCLGDLVRKLGESILHELLPILERGLDSDRAEIRQGVCVALTEIMATASKTQVEEFVQDSVKLVRKALVDEDSDVREAAAQTFDMLHQHMGRHAIDEVLPTLLNMLKAGGKQANPASAFALEALKEIMAVRSNVVFPVLIPTLISRPITSFNAQALSSLITVAGSALNKRLEAILSALMDALEDGDDAEADIKETIKVLLVNVEDDDGVYQVMSILTTAVRNGSVERKKVATHCLQVFCQGNQEALEADTIEDWLELLIAMLRGGEGESEAVSTAWGALDALVKRIKKEEMEKFVPTLRRALRDAEEGMGESEVLEGLSIPKGISPILPIFLQGLMYGSADCREQSALGLGDLVRRTSPDALKPFVTQITGPLIRVIGDRFPSSVKSAILMSLSLLLDRVAPMLKPFLPQLQRTFVKCLSESSGMVRDRAARCLSSLIPLQTRLDPLVVELSQGLRGADDMGVRAAVWEALYGLVNGVGGPGRDLNDTSRKTIQALLTEGISSSGEHDEVARVGAAKVMGAYGKYVSPEESKDLISSQILSANGHADWFRVEGALRALHNVILCAPLLLQELDLVKQAQDLVVASLHHNKPQVIEEAVTAASRILGVPAYAADSQIRDPLVDALTDVVQAAGSSTEARRDAVVALKNLAKSSRGSVATKLATVVPALMQCVRDRNASLKHAAERALLHVLDVGTGSDTLQKYLGTLDATTARQIGDYARRVLSKLDASGSDDEAEQNDVIY